MPEAETTIVFADLSGFTALTEAHGDQTGTAVLLRFYDMTRGLLRNGATLVKTIGDAVMLVAPDPETAVAIVLDLRRVTESTPNFPDIRAGLHVGPVKTSDGDYFGAAVNLAARVAAHASAGQILCTATLAERIADAGLCSIGLLGPVRFRNVQNAVVVCELGAHPAAGAAHVDPICRMHVPGGSEIAWVRIDDVEHYFCSLPCLQLFLVGHLPAEGERA